MNYMKFHFQSLMPDLIDEAIESIGLRADSGLTALNSYENRVYQFLDEERKRWVIKFYRPERWSKAQILEEHLFSQELAELTIPVVSPYAFSGKTLHQCRDIMFAVFPSIGGRTYELDNDEHLEQVGRVLGRIHLLGKEQVFAERPIIGLNEYLYQPQFELLKSNFIPHAVRERFADSLETLIQTTQNRWWDEWQPCRLHGDCHSGNILWRDGPLFVDLDDARTGPVIQDLWMLLHGSRRDQQIQLDILLDAYSEFGEFDAKELGLIEPLRSMRMVHYLAWIVRRWQDPAFPKSFPWIQEGDFWEQQIKVFDEQTRLLKEPPLQLLQMY